MNAAVLAGGIVAVALTILGAGLHRWASPPRQPRPLGRPTRSTSAGRRRRRSTPGDVEVATWCERVATGIRAGGSLRRAVIDADAGTEPHLRPFPDAGLALERGRGLSDALASDSLDTGGPVGLLAPVMIAAAELGGPAAAALERVADTLLARAAEREERRTSSAQARLSARVMTTLPFGVLGILVLSEPTIRDALTTPAGVACLVVGCSLNGLGWWWMHHVIGAAA